MKRPGIGGGSTRVRLALEILPGEKRQGLVVAATFQVMGQMAVHRGWQLVAQGYDAPGDGLELLQMALGVARVESAVCDDGTAVAQGGGEFLVDG